MTLTRAQLQSQGIQTKLRRPNRGRAGIPERERASSICSGSTNVAQAARRVGGGKVLAVKGPCDFFGCYRSCCRII